MLEGEDGVAGCVVFGEEAGGVALFPTRNAPAGDGVPAAEREGSAGLGEVRVVDKAPAGGNCTALQVSIQAEQQRLLGGVAIVEERNAAILRMPAGVVLAVGKKDSLGDFTKS